MSEHTPEPISATEAESNARARLRHEDAARRGGPLAWMTRNSVAANVIMLILVLGGLAMIPFIRQEVFPEFDLDIVTVVVPYPGASPEEVEQGVVLSIEEAVRGVEGVKAITSSASEGAGVVTVELVEGSDLQKATSDIKNNVDRITSFPGDAERPVVSIATRRREVVRLVLYGDVDEHVLHELGEQAREGLLQSDDITYIEMSGVRPLEVSVEVPQETLQRHGLTLDRVAQTIRAASVELPGGSVKTQKGEVLIRTMERRNTGAEFADVIIVSQRDGTELRLGDIAQINDGFRETDEESFFNGKPAVELVIFRVADETPIAISEAVDAYIEEAGPNLPPGVEMVKWDDRSEVYKQRMELLLNNAYMGLVLVFVTLGLLLQIRLAFWVMLGIPISFLGSLLLMPVMDVSINMISLFAFILTLGIVVDDAIVVGEAVFKRREEGMAPLEAAIAGVREVAGPVVFSVLTTCMTFIPLLYVPGTTGRFFSVIPIIVISILMISLFESLFILPAHLAHSKESRPGSFLGWIDRQQGKFSRVLDRFIDRVYAPVLRFSLAQRWLVVSIGIATLIGTVGVVAGGRIKFTFMPKIDSDVVRVNLEMQYGTPIEETRLVEADMLRKAEETLEELGGKEAVSRGIFATVGRVSARGFGGGGGASGGHLAQVSVFLVPADQREFASSEFAQLWRKKLGDVPGVEALAFDYSTGPASGSAIDLEVSHPRMEVLREASGRLAGSISEYAGVKDVDDGFRDGKEQMDFNLRPDARRIGLSETDMARQLRASFFGVEAVRQQRGRHELRVYVRLPKDQRVREYHVEELMLRTPAGAEVPLTEVADVKRGASYTSITRKDGRRAVRVTADVEQGANANQVIASLQEEVLPQLIADYPGLAWGFAGQQQQQGESLAALRRGFALALLAMMALMAIAFRSYVQPLIIMIAIPFGIVGAIWGHLIMGYDLSLMSVMGAVALSGVVVNDSIVMISAINDFRADGQQMREAVFNSGVRRFRAILLTSATTFFGLAPMMLEKSVQARFLIPMALSLGFGIVFSTVIVLLLVPCVYTIVDDTHVLVERIFNFLRSLYTSSSAPPPPPVEEGGVGEPGERLP